MKDGITILQGDITKQHVDAIVNAANNSLLGGGGVDGAIHMAAGPGLLEECRKMNGCETGKAKITGAHLLPNKWIIHTVGPIWSGGSENEDQLLSRCYQNCFSYSREYDIRSIAFPAISTGAYGFPLGSACKIALKETKRFLSLSQNKSKLSKIVFVCFSKKDLDVYNQSFAKIFNEPGL